jgi:hypothetical protein
MRQQQLRRVVAMLCKLRVAGTVGGTAASPTYAATERSRSARTFASSARVLPTAAVYAC